jgi:hypothetical protein
MKSLNKKAAGRSLSGGITPGLSSHCPRAWPIQLVATPEERPPAYICLGARPHLRLRQFGGLFIYASPKYDLSFLKRDLTGLVICGMTSNPRYFLLQLFLTRQSLFGCIFSTIFLHCISYVAAFCIAEC